MLKEKGEHTNHPCDWLEYAAPDGLEFCVQMAGDVMYFAKGQEHATCNLEDFVLGIGAQGHLPGNWHDFLHVNDNKEELSAFSPSR